MLAAVLLVAFVGGRPGGLTMDTASGGSVLLPDDGLPVIERSAVRLVVLDAEGRLLLFRTRDLCNPGLGTWWELPGGGIEPGETYHDAAVRDLREETGIIAVRSQVGPPTWKREPHSGTGGNGASRTR